MPAKLTKPAPKIDPTCRDFRLNRADRTLLRMALQEYANFKDNLIRTYPYGDRKWRETLRAKVDHARELERLFRELKSGEKGRTDER